MRKLLRRYTPDHGVIEGNRWLAPFRNTLLHPRLWHLNRHSAAGGVAVGLFCGLLPAPFQMLSAALCAIAFKINLPLAIFTTLYTNPLTFVPLYLLAFWIGDLLVGSETGFVPPPTFDTAHFGLWLETSFAWLAHLGLPLVVGVLLLASLFALTGYFGVQLAWRIHLLRALKRRKLRRRQNSVA